MAFAFASDDDFASPSTPRQEISEPPIGAVAAAPGVERSFASWDGAELFYRAWLPAGTARGALLLLHRGHEHAGRWQEVVERLALPDLAVFAWDARGHGRSAGENFGFDTLVRDLEAFAAHLAAAHGIARRDMALIANSVGAVIAGAWLRAYAPPLRAAVLASPALRVRLHLPFAVPLLRLAARLKPDAKISSYVTGRLLTHDRDKARDYDNDPLITPRRSPCGCCSASTMPAAASWPTAGRSRRRC